MEGPEAIATGEVEPTRSPAVVTARVSAFYETHPYPPPVDDIAAYRARWDDARRRADAHLFWPADPYRDDRTILVAGCGTSQAAHYAVRWPNARVLGIDVSTQSLEYSRELARTHGIDNLELRELPIERAAELGASFDHVVSTGVLHHLPDPDAGLRALRDVLAPRGTLHLMVYAPYGRAGVYLLQEYCRRAGIGWSEDEIRDLIASLKALPPDHPLVPLLRNAPDFKDPAGIADALLHPQDRAYSVPQLHAFLKSAGLAFGRWVRQAPYLAECGAVALTPHAERLRALGPADQAAALELFRGTMVRHTAIAVHHGAPGRYTPGFTGEGWLGYVPLRLPGTIAVRERLPAGAAAVLINQNHTSTDLYLPIPAPQDRLYNRIDGTRPIGEIAGPQVELARDFFRRLWEWDQVVFDTSAAG